MKSKVSFGTIVGYAGLTFFLVGLWFPSFALATVGYISDTDKYAWSENGGWLNFKPTNGNVSIYTTYLSGYLWAENLGWIKLGASAGGPYLNTTSANWGVNRDGSGNLSGYAWGEMIGWINFKPTNGGVTIDPGTGSFNGYAWSENIGWLHFKNSSPAYNVKAFFGNPPVANNQNVTAITATPVAITLTASDPDHDPLTYQIVANPASGVLTGAAPNVTYTSNAGYIGADSFTFKANDGWLDSNVAAVSLTVVTGSVNHPPVASDQRVNAAKDTLVNITLTATDADNDPLAYQVLTLPTHGTLGGAAPNLAYTPAPGFIGQDSFTFKANDGQADSNAATVTILVEARILTVTEAGLGSGTVTSSPAGIDCGAACQYVFPIGARVALTSHPTAGSAFDGWGGGTCCGTGECTLTLQEDTTVTATYNTDSDGDGVSDVIENAGPNNGDANYDGIPDSQQSNVATFPNVNGQYVTLVSHLGTQLVGVRAGTSPSPTDVPPGVCCSMGFYGFQVRGGGASLTMALILPRNTKLNTYYKYGSTLDNPTPHWYEFMYDGATGAEIFQEATRTVIVLHFVEGRRGDDDLTVNGVISDLGGPAEVSVPSGGGSSGGCFINSLWLK